MIVTVILLTGIVLYSLISWLWRRMKKDPREPPLYPGDLPVIGHAHLFTGDTVHLWNMLKEMAISSLDNGGVVTIALGNWKFYYLTDPEDCNLVGNSCLQKDALYDMAKPWLGEGLVTASVHTWKHHRKLVNPAFSQHVLDDYLTVFNAQSRVLNETLDKEAGKGFFNHTVYLDRCALEIICLTAMGINDDDELLKNFHYMDAVDDMCHIFAARMQRAWMHSEFLYSFTKLKKRQDNLVKILHDMSNKIIQKRKVTVLNSEYCEKKESSSKRIKSFLSLLLESSADGSLTDKEIREEVDTIVAAGYDTSATLLTFALVVIGSYKDVEEKIYKEVVEVFEGSDRDVHKHDLPKLVYLEAVLKEVLRLYPVIPLIARYLDRDVQLKNYTLSAGQSCLFSIYGIQRHKVWGPDRLDFSPERWLDPGRLPDLLNAFAGFGVGRRSCIGQKFAFMSAKTTLCHILRRYRIHGDCTKMVLKMDVMLKPDSGHHIRIEKR